MIRNELKPTEGELEILQILWKHGPCSVKLVHELISERKEVGYTTSLKMLQIMVDKGLATREAEGKIHLYKAAIRESSVKKNYLKTMIDQVFEGSPMDLVLQTLGNYKASPGEIKELKEMIKQLENKKA